MSKKASPPSVRWGLLSTARINRALIHPIQHSKHSRLVAVASRSQARASVYAQEWGIPNTFGSYEDMLADPDIDVIYNSLPNSMHAEWSIKAMQAGKHVLCEKPLCLTLAEMDELEAASQVTGKIVTEAFMYRHHPQTIKVKEIVTSGVLGDLRLIRGTFSYKLTNPQNPRLEAGLGGGSIWDVGCYPISYARFLTGCEPDQVFGWQMPGPSGIDLLFVGQLRYPNQVYAQFDSSFDVPFRVMLEVVGTRGMVTIPNPYKPGMKDKITLTVNGLTENVPVRGRELYSGEVMDAENIVRHAGQPRISLAESRGNVEAITALLRSAQTGQAIILKQS